MGFNSGFKGLMEENPSYGLEFSKFSSAMGSIIFCLKVSFGHYGNHR
jgi:hypothetical protein